MNQSHIVCFFLLPPHQQSAVAVRPTVRALDHPPLRLVPSLASLLGGLPVALRDVRCVAAPLERSSDRRVIVTLISRQVWLARCARSGSVDRDALKRGTYRLRVVPVRSRHLQPDGRSTLIGQDMALCAEFTPIYGAFPRRLAAQRGFRRRTIDGLPAPPNAAQPLVLFDEQAPDAFEDSAPDPLLEAAVERRTATELSGRMLPLPARPQHVQAAVEAGALRHGRYP